MNKEAATELLRNIKKDLENITGGLKRQELVGGIQPQHLIQVADIKASIALTVSIKLLEEIAGVSMETLDQSQPSPIVLS